MTIFVIIQYLNMKFNEFPLMLYDSDGNVCACTVQFRPKHFREIFYPALYAETGEGDLEDDADAVAPPPPAILSEDYDEIGGGGGDVEKRSSRAHALRVRNDAAFHALRHNTNYDYDDVPISYPWLASLIDLISTIKNYLGRPPLPFLLRVRRAGASRGYALRVRKSRPSFYALRVRKDMNRGHALRED